MQSIKSICLALMCAFALVCAFAVPAYATGPSNCPAGQTALAQKYGTSQYCATNICVAEYKHLDTQECSPPDMFHPLPWGCVAVKYEARPRFPQPPSPSGAWGNQPACPAALNTAASWY